MADPITFARAMIDALDEPALVVEGGIVTLANEAARSALGDFIEGRDIRLSIRHPQALAHIREGRAGELDITGLVDPGRSWRLKVRRIDPSLVLVRLSDTSASVSAERMRVDFVANASHELRTPLSAVVGYAETLAEEGDLPSATVASFGGTIRTEARRMLRIVEDLMSLSRIEADRFIAPGGKIDIAALLNQSIANARHPSAGCEIRLTADPALPLVRGDETLLLQLFDNLLANALRYGCSSPGAGIEVVAERSGNDVRVAVIDRGTGIAREHLPRLTERFYRVDDARSRESGGTGLGLAIVKHIVERHRGTLTIESTLGVGTTVSVTVPAAG